MELAKIRELLPHLDPVLRDEVRSYATKPNRKHLTPDEALLAASFGVRRFNMLLKYLDWFQHLSAEERESFIAAIPDADDYENALEIPELGMRVGLSSKPIPSKDYNRNRRKKSTTTATTAATADQQLPQLPHAAIAKQSLAVVPSAENADVFSQLPQHQTKNLSPVATTAANETTTATADEPPAAAKRMPAKLEAKNETGETVFFEGDLVIAADQKTGHRFNIKSPNLPAMTAAESFKGKGILLFKAICKLLALGGLGTILWYSLSYMVQATSQVFHSETAAWLAEGFPVLFMLIPATLIVPNKKVAEGVRYALIVTYFAAGIWTLISSHAIDIAKNVTAKVESSEGYQLKKAEYDSIRESIQTTPVNWIKSRAAMTAQSTDVFTTMENMKIEALKNVPDDIAKEAAATFIVRLLVFMGIIFATHIFAKIAAPVFRQLL